MVMEKLQLLTLPSASDVASKPKDFMKLSKRCPIYMHRPLTNCTIPLSAMCEVFGQFQEVYHESVPRPEDCKLARRLCEISSEVSLACFPL